MRLMTRLTAVLCVMALLATACSADRPDDSASTTTVVEPLSFVMADEAFKHPAGETIQVDITDHCFEPFGLIYVLSSLKLPVESKLWASVQGTVSGAASSRILYIPVPPVFTPGLYELSIGCDLGNRTEKWRNFRVDIIDAGIDPPTLPEGQQVVLDQHRLTIDLADTIALDDRGGTPHVWLRATGGSGETDWAISYSVRPPTDDVDNVILVIDIPKHLHGPFTVSLGSFGEDNNPRFDLQLE